LEEDLERTPHIKRFKAMIGELRRMNEYLLSVFSSVWVYLRHLVKVVPEHQSCPNPDFVLDMMGRVEHLVMRKVAAALVLLS
jgi:hypothetical protein